MTFNHLLCATLSTAIVLCAAAMNMESMSCHGAESPAQTSARGEDRDLIVVGAGIAGLSAALEAGRTGTQVTVVDMWSVFGGHAVMSGGLVCMVDTPVQRANGVIDSPELATSDFFRRGDDSNPEWVRLYANESRREVYDWLARLGMEWSRLFPRFPGNSVRRQHEAKGRGIGLVSPIYLACLCHTNITFIWNTKVTGLLIESNRVVGVATTNLRTSEKTQFRALNVILATGGFESNLQLVREYWPQSLPSGTSGAYVLLGSGINSVGSGLTILENTSAAFTNLDHQLFYTTGLVDPRDPTFRRGNNSFNLQSIWINAQGRRFVREFDQMPDPKATLPAVLKQTPPTYWSIFDAKTRPAFFVSGTGWDDTNTVEREIFANPHMAPWVKSAPTLEELAHLAGIPADALAESVRRWNQMVAHGEDTDFHRFGPGDAIQAPTIDTPPFFSVQFFPLTRKSMGGVAVDLHCRVLDKQGQLIPGLYAVGEVAGVGGINGKAALEGTMLGPGILMGRIAAREVIHEVNSPKRLTAGEVNEGGSDTISRKGEIPDAQTLQSWREVLRQLIAKEEPGRLHFRNVHRVVLERAYDCVQCHVEQSPLASTAESLDRRFLTRSCQFCHGARE